MILLLASVASAEPAPTGAATARAPVAPVADVEAPSGTEGPDATASDATGPDGTASDGTASTDPWDRVADAHPALAAAIVARHPDDATLDAAAAVLLAADARLVDLLVPAAPDGPLADLVGESPGVDLVDAEVWLDGTVLRGAARGRGIVENGVWLDLDLQGGPAADLRLGFGRGWSRANALDGGDHPPPGPAPVLGDDRIDFEYDLARAGRASRGLAGAVTARLRTADGRVEDVGPAGALGPLPDEAVDVLLALLHAGPIADADLAVAIAVTFGALRPLVADDVVATVDTDAVAWLRYGEGLDAWLAENDADWRLGELDALGKLVWAWPAGQAIVYGAVPLLGERAPLDAARWRFVVPSAATLTRLRDTAPIGTRVVAVARAVDDTVNARLRYRAHDALMDSLCRRGVRTEEECQGWLADRKASRTLGTLGDTPVHLWEGVSASWQVDVFAREGAYVGDCATATQLAIATMQALGIPAVGMGWSGADLDTPTHDVPLWYDGTTFRATQRGPGPAWTRSSAFVYVTLPAIHPVNAWTGAHEPGAWTRGGAVAGGWTTYGSLTGVLRDGLPGATVGRWIDTQAAGGWPGI